MNTEGATLVGEKDAPSDYPYLMHAHGGTAWMSHTALQGDGRGFGGDVVSYSGSNLLLSGTLSATPNDIASAVHMHIAFFRHSENSQPLGITFISISIYR